MVIAFATTKKRREKAHILRYGVISALILKQTDVDLKYIIFYCTCCLNNAIFSNGINGWFIFLGGSMTRSKFFLYFVLMSFFACAHSMEELFYSKNWVPRRQGMGANEMVIWKGADSRELITIKFNPRTQRYSGNVISSRNPSRVMRLPKSEVREYLIKLKELSE